MYISILQDPIAANLFDELFRQYGPIGVAFGIVTYIILKQNKRINDLEEMQQTHYDSNLKTHKEMIDSYVDLVKSQTTVLADLTTCLNAIKSTLERVERRNE
jgi:hypothetical protein